MDLYSKEWSDELARSFEVDVEFECEWGCEFGFGVAAGLECECGCGFMLAAEELNADRGSKLAAPCALGFSVND